MVRGGGYSSRVLLERDLSQKGGGALQVGPCALCFFNLQLAMVVGAGVRGGGLLGSRGWLVGRAAAGEVTGGRVVAGGGGALGFRVAGGWGGLHSCRT